MSTVVYLIKGRKSEVCRCRNLMSAAELDICDIKWRRVVSNPRLGETGDLGPSKLAPLKPVQLKELPLQRAKTFMNKKKNFEWLPRVVLLLVYFRPYAPARKLREPHWLPSKLAPAHASPPTLGWPGVPGLRLRNSESFVHAPTDIRRRYVKATNPQMDSFRCRCCS